LTGELDREFSQLAVYVIQKIRSNDHAGEYEEVTCAA
jgi:hypothetical protein